MNDKLHLKNILKIIKENDYRVPQDININDLAYEMINNIGSKDSKLRDNYIYTIFSYWIQNTDFLNDKLKDILKIARDEKHMFYKIGEINTDSVFTRSFSVLLIPLILINHRKNKFLTEAEVKNIFFDVTQYFLKELDLRGFVKCKGWAHSVAHTADALDELAICTEIGYEELLYILEIIKNKVKTSNYVFINEEDERLVTAIISVLNRKLISNEEFCMWIKSFNEIKKVGIYPDDSNIKINVKNFLRSLYFRILPLENKEKIVVEIAHTLSIIDKM